MTDNPKAELKWTVPWPGIAGCAVTLIALVVSAQHTGVSSQWHQDVGLIRVLGLWPLGAQGVVSTLLSQLGLWFPAGNCVYRAAMVANLGAALAGLIFFQLLRDLLANNAHTPRLGTGLAMLGALLLTLGLPMQKSATVACGASLSVALCLGAIWLQSRISTSDTMGPAKSYAALLGALIVASLTEQLWAGIVALLVMCTQYRALSVVSRPPHVRGTFLGATIAVAALSVPLIRMLWPHRSIPELPSLGASVSYEWRGLVQFSLGGVRWWRDAGTVLCVAAAFGSVWGIAKPRLRARTASWLAVLLVASFFGAQPDALRASPVAALRVLSAAGVIALATVAAQTLALLLLRSQVSYLGGSIIVIVALYALLVAVHADDADIALESRYLRGNDVFTQEAIWTLPRYSVVLVQSHELAHRIWAERLSHGARPDVLVVTPDRLQHRPDLQWLLSVEPALTPLVREWIVRGRPSEYVLSQFSDVRPLFVEMDMKWDARLREHVAAWGLWSEFHSQNLGRSDRYSKMHSTRATVDRVIAACNGSVPPDTGTLQLVGARIREHVLVAASVGDRPGLSELLEQLEKTGTHSGFARALQKQLQETPHGAIDWAAASAL